LFTQNVPRIIWEKIVSKKGKFVLESCPGTLPADDLRLKALLGAAVAGYVIFPPLLFAMDLKKADYKEMGAYQKRRDHLIELAKEHDCTWCKDVETDEELMMRAEAEYQELKKQRQKENTTNREREH
jgi:hypothetical protein